MYNCLEAFSKVNNDDNCSDIKVVLLQNVIKYYNSKARQYTGNYYCTISVPKDKKHMPVQYMSLSEYIKSKKIWVQILNFLKLDDVSDVYDYIDVMIRNWHNIETNIGFKIKNPTANIIFSTKLTFLYKKFKDVEKDKYQKNYTIVTNISDNKINLLNPSIQSDINSLYRLKNINSDLKYRDILNIFKAEFSDNFKNITNNLSEIELERIITERSK